MTELKKLPSVKKVNYTSQDQALALYKSENSNNKSLIQALSVIGSNPLPASIEISPTNTENIQPIKNFLDEPQNVALQDPKQALRIRATKKQRLTKLPMPPILSGKLA